MVVALMSVILDVCKGKQSQLQRCKFILMSQNDRSCFQICHTNDDFLEKAESFYLGLHASGEHANALSTRNFSPPTDVAMMLPS